MQRAQRMRNARDRLVLVGLMIMAVYFLYVLTAKQYFEADSYTTDEMPLLHALVITGILCVLADILRRLLGKLILRGELPLPVWGFNAVLIAATVLPRLFLMLAVKVDPTSDFRMYFDMAELYGTYGDYNSTDYIIVVAPNLLLFIIIMGEIFKAFGSSIFVAQCMNLILFTGAVLVFFELARRFMPNTPAFMLALLYAFSPNNVLFSLMIGTEPLALFPFLAGILFTINALRAHSARDRVLYGLFGGVIFAFSNIIRPNSVIALVALLIFAALYLIPEGKGRRGQIALAAALVILSFMGFNRVYGALQDEVYKKELGINFGWTLYEGLDNENYGAWSPENAATLYRVIDEFPTDQAQQELLRLAIERTRDYTAQDWAHLITRKGVNIWVYNDYVYGYPWDEVENPGLINPSDYLLPIINVINYSYWLLLCVLAITSLEYVWKRWRGARLSGNVLIFYLPIIGMMILHSFATSIPRYHYIAMPCFLLVIYYARLSLASPDGSVRPAAPRAGLKRDALAARRGKEPDTGSALPEEET